MRIARIAHAGRSVHAVQEGDTLLLLDDAFAPMPRRTGTRVPVDEARLLAPVEPRVIVGMAHNTGPGDRRKPPQAFLKSARSLIGPGDPIPVPPGIGRVDAEGELAVVIGRPAHHLTRADALTAVLGYTIGNDVTTRHLQRSDPLWTTAKGYDGFTPLGPWIETDLDATDTRVTVSLNGRALRPASTQALARGVVEVLVYLTSFMTLGPGDVVLTGAPGEYTPISPGDTVDIAASGIGRLVNPVVQARGASRRIGEPPCPPLGPSTSPARWMR
ncbi:2-keto-4-pentenoate hydratase/2-oxohepta-3-ene-1,7-dioic acid hydratase (catechol pathway) [Modestobacter sp. DSM 44400]|uniref:fumarylacetoacetate hydrolase family protein n=1 Tax=Modestobacter sp. DSM 44400 TaxID=1550230 RepID=UPI0008946872|nr:fumarylacetoacetate hydrolase family protein [Modestobacter sp. DSM 44400]SDY11778.1 2-keto-4-pentenoate hydratase/2-oxohepta-3-ene-1,7-dioic acid hydratase (catechol pathway) [Modestobacter sp. DSM 44400]